jgi:SNF2 family DNA or RNA helicase
MLILPDKNTIALKLKNPNKITTVIPSARVMQWRGVPVTLVPHNLDETLVLKNLGFNIPSPVQYKYDWSGQYEPFDVQEITVDMLTLYPRAFVLNDMGSGKTISTLWAYDFLKQKGRVNRAMIVAPLSTLERAWGDEVFKHFPHLNYAVVHGSREKRLKLLRDKSYDLYIINHDGMKIVAEEMAERDDIDLVVIDELAVLRNAQTDLWKAANVICNKQRPGIVRRVWGLTGTPTPNAPTDAYAQVKLVTPEKIHFGFGRFKDKVMMQISQYVWIPRPDAQEIVAEYMHPSVRFALEDCVDLPELIHVERDAALNSEQAKAYNQMMSLLATEVASGEIIAVNEGVKASKLIQIACGVAYDVDGVERVTGADARLKVVKELIEESASGKAIVFCPFRSVVSYVGEHLRKSGYRVGIIDGSTSKRERDLIFRQLQSDNLLDVIVAIPSCMAHGITLTAASTIIWYAPVTSNEIFTQANARCHRPGQKHKCVVAMIGGTPIERRYYKRLKDKQSAQGLLLEILRTER